MKQKLKTPWLKIIKCPVLYALTASNIGHSYILFTVVNELPKYMKYILRYHVKANAFSSAMPYLCVWLSALLSGYISDVIEKKNCISVTRLRKIFVGIGCFFPGVFMVAAAYTGCNRTLAVVFFCMSMTTMGLFYAGGWVIYVDVAPTFSATLTSISNVVGAFQGYLCSFVIANVVGKTNRVRDWRIAFWIAFGFCLVTTLVFLVFGSAEREQWDIDAEKAATEQSPGEGPLIPNSEKK